MKTPKITNALLTQAIELGFDFNQFSNTDTLQDVSEMLWDFIKENSDKLPQIEDECEVNSHGKIQSVSYGDYLISGDIVDFSQHWHKPADTKVFHSDFVFIDPIDGLAKNVNLYYLVGETEYNKIDTYDVVFDSDDASNSKGMALTYNEAYRYIKMYNGTSESYWADYKSGTVSIVCNETGETVYEEEVL